MQSNLQQSVVNAANSPASAWSVVVAMLGSGISYLLEVLPPILAVISMFMGIVLAILLARNHILKWKLMAAELKIKKAELKAIDERKKSRTKDLDEIIS